MNVSVGSSPTRVDELAAGLSTRVDELAAGLSFVTNRFMMVGWSQCNFFSKESALVQKTLIGTLRLRLDKGMQRHIN